jgi:hypothetical protein
MAGPPIREPSSVPPLGAPLSQPASPAPPAPEAPAPPPRPPAPGGIPDDAYLRATRLALDGRDRNEIGAQLSAEFGIADPEPVLNRVLGAA